MLSCGGRSSISLAEVVSPNDCAAKTCGAPVGSDSSSDPRGSQNAPTGQRKTAAERSESGSLPLAEATPLGEGAGAALVLRVRAAHSPEATIAAAVRAVHRRLDGAGVIVLSDVAGGAWRAVRLPTPDVVRDLVRDGMPRHVARHLLRHPGAGHTWAVVVAARSGTTVVRVALDAAPH